MGGGGCRVVGRGARLVEECVLDLGLPAGVRGERGDCCVRLRVNLLCREGGCAARPGVSTGEGTGRANGTPRTDSLGRASARAREDLAGRISAGRNRFVSFPHHDELPLVAVRGVAGRDVDHRRSSRREGGGELLVPRLVPVIDGLDIAVEEVLILARDLEEVRLRRAAGAESGDMGGGW